MFGKILETKDLVWKKDTLDNLNNITSFAYVNASKALT